MSEGSEGFDLIVTIVPRGNAEDVLTISCRAGAEGGTVLLARGMGVHEQKRIMGIPIEPEKELVMTITPSHKTRQILEAIRAGIDLDAPGHGVAFVVRLQDVAGIAHLMAGRSPEPGGPAGPNGSGDAGGSEGSGSR